MPEKRGPLEGAKGIAPQGPRDKAKAGLLEPQSPAVPTHTRRYGVSMRRYQEQPVRVLRAATSAWQGDGHRGH